MKTGIRRFTVQAILLLMLAASAAALRPAQAQAAEKKLKKQESTTDLKKAKKKAVRVSKGNTTLISRGKMGYVLFKAPKTKKYTFAFSGLQTEGINPEDDINEGYITVAAPFGRTDLYAVKVKTEYGANTTLYVETETSARLQPETKKKSNTPLPARSMKMKLKKGQMLFFYCSMDGYPWQIRLTIR